MTMATPCPRTPRLIDFGDLPTPPSALFRDYVASRSGALEFFASDWSPDAILEAARRAVSHERPRAAVAKALVRQQSARGARAAECAARSLADDRCIAVVTGQQPVLFGGPMLVLYKALAIRRLAAFLRERWDGPVVPVFWIASDDHDFEEVRTITVFDAEERPGELRYAPHDDPGGRPTSSIVLDATITETLNILRSLLPRTSWSDALIDQLAAAYQPGRALSDAFGLLLSALTPDVVLLDPGDAALKSLMTELFVREAVERSPVSRMAAGVGERLRAAGYHEQVPLRSGYLSLFWSEDGARRALAVHADSIEVRGTNRRLSFDDLASLVRARPEHWSPGALLRPLAQDLLLPTAVYVGGPAEIAYHAQLGAAYADFGVSRPVVFPRPSVTLLTPSNVRALESERLSLTQALGDVEQLVSERARQEHPAVESSFASIRRALEREMSTVSAAVSAVDPTLEAAAETTLGRAWHPIAALHEKALRAVKRREQTRATRLRRAHDMLLPGSELQERRIALCSYLARHEPSWIGDLEARLDPWARAHQVIEL
ncbi:MAG: bacillithiol biosynthesis cysteine-adding enzyme BshC [Vicinamibacteria bacterium]|nr:bacillithiol biosynthesis cysteine-adding enzyme BshC [Vicinamibacteria bacterium]